MYRMLCRRRSRELRENEWCPEAVADTCEITESQQHLRDTPRFPAEIIVNSAEVHLIRHRITQQMA